MSIYSTIDLGQSPIYLDILILFAIPPFQTQLTRLCIKIDTFDTNGEGGSNTAATRRSGRRFILHLSNGRGSHIIIFAYQIVCMPHIFWLFRHKSHRSKPFFKSKHTILQ